MGMGRAAAQEAINSDPVEKKQKKGQGGFFGAPEDNSGLLSGSTSSTTRSSVLGG